MRRMSEQKRYKNLLSPLKIGDAFILKNRMIKAPQSTWYWESDCTAGERVIRFYETIAKGGASLLVVSAINWTYPQPGGIYGCLYDDKFIPGMKELTRRVKQHDCKIMCQLHHTGPSAPCNFDGTKPIGPSDLELADLPTPPPGVVPSRGLSIAEIKEQKELYWQAAERAKQAGFDGIELHLAHAYFFESFTSGIWNHRTDQYGIQTMENRTRLIVELIRGLKARLGADYPLGVRMNVREWGVKGALTSAQCVEVAKVLEREGVVYISASGYGYGAAPFRYLPDYFTYPEPDVFMEPYVEAYKGQGLFVEGAAAIKRAVHIPVAVAGRMDEDLAESLIKEGKVDFVALGRTLWADPEFPNKVKEGRTSDIVRCTRCATCEDPMVGPRRCRVNPSLGKEAELAIEKADRPKKVMVVGGGPAGMEAARVAALRGHSVSLYEKEGRLGGYLPLAAMIKGTEVENVLPIVSYLERQLRALPVAIHLGVRVDKALIEREAPDALVLAVGGRYRLPDIPGIRSRIVENTEELSNKAKLPLRVFGPQLLYKLSQLFLPVGKNVIILGGQIEGVQGAVFMRKRGRRVTILESSDSIGKGIPPRFMTRIVPWFEKTGVQVLTGVCIREVTDKGVRLTTKEGHVYLKEADTVMVLMPQQPNDDLYLQVAQEAKLKVHRIGSANGADKGALIVDALRDAREVGCLL